MEWFLDVYDNLIRYFTRMDWVDMTFDRFTGQSTLVRASWDSLPLFPIAGLALVVVHALFKFVIGRSRRHRSS